MPHKWFCAVLLIGKMKKMLRRSVRIKKADGLATQIRTYANKNTDPFSNDTIPADNTGAEPWMWLDDSSLQKCAALNTGAFLHNNIRSNCYVRSNPTTSSNTRIRMLQS